jgi:hypothetical protein
MEDMGLKFYRDRLDSPAWLAWDRMEGTPGGAGSPQPVAPPGRSLSVVVQRDKVDCVLEMRFPQVLEPGLKAGRKKARIYVFVYTYLVSNSTG